MKTYVHINGYQKAEWAMSLSRTPCNGNGCDLDDPCPRHSRMTEVIERYGRLLKRRHERKAGMET